MCLYSPGVARRWYSRGHWSCGRQWEAAPAPGAAAGAKGAYGVPVQYERSFRWKLSQFRYLCQSNALPNHIKLSVSRQTLFEDSFHQLMRLPAYELRRRLYIIFRGEEGLDYGGVAR